MGFSFGFGIFRKAFELTVFSLVMAKLERFNLLPGRDVS
jgi:hypothetical protein